MLFLKNGVSTACLYPLETEKSLDTLLGYGFTLFEYFSNSFSEIDTNFVKEVRKKLDFYGAEIRSLHPFTCSLEGVLLFSDYERRTIDSLEFYKRYFEAANILGANILVLHGQTPLGNGEFANSDNHYIENFRRLFLTGKSMGINVCQENVYKYRGQNIDFIKKMNNQLKDDVRFVFDVKQAIRSNQDPFKMVEAMGSNLIHVHLSDNTKDESCLLPFNGNFDFEKLFLQLKNLGYSGDIFTEVYRNNYNDYKEIANSKILVENLLNKLKL